MNNVQFFRPWLRNTFPTEFEHIAKVLGSEKFDKHSIVQFLFPDYYPKCEECGVETHITPTGSLLFGYQRFCSRVCSNKAEQTNKKRTESTLAKYGVSNISQSTEIKKKKTRTCLANYGVKYYSQTEEYKARRTLRNEEWLAKCIATSIDRYGTEWPIQNPELYAEWNTLEKKSC